MHAAGAKGKRHGPLSRANGAKGRFGCHRMPPRTPRARYTAAARASKDPALLLIHVFTILFVVMT